MFDNAPSNLPVEPTPGNGQSLEPVEAPVPIVNSTKKEPEDIFSGIDRLEKPQPQLSHDQPARGGFPLKFVISIVAALLIIGGLVFAFWFFVLNKATSVSAPSVLDEEASTLPVQPVEQVEKPPVIEPDPTENIPKPEINETPIIEPLPPAAIFAPTQGIDSDMDLLTDSEEVFFGSDVSIKDTDGDGYSDGSEVQNGYSPLAKNKMLSAEPFMTSEAWDGWAFLLPKPWSIVSSPENLQAAYIATGSAARFNLLTTKLSSEQNLTALMNGAYPNVLFDPMKIKSGYEAIQSNDKMIVGILSGDTVLIISYDLNGESVYDYGTVYTMIINSVSKPAL